MLRLSHKSSKKEVDRKVLSNLSGFHKAWKGGEIWAGYLCLGMKTGQSRVTDKCFQNRCQMALSRGGFWWNGSFLFLLHAWCSVDLIWIETPCLKCAYNSCCTQVVVESLFLSLRTNVVWIQEWFHFVTFELLFKKTNVALNVWRKQKQNGLQDTGVNASFWQTNFPALEIFLGSARLGQTAWLAVKHFWVPVQVSSFYLLT